jgi:hypothetical protein
MALDAERSLCPVVLPDGGGLATETWSGVVLIQIYNCKQCVYLLLYRNSVKMCTVYNI